jgi:Fur family transcriptional regulator, iron response regulator
MKQPVEKQPMPIVFAPTALAQQRLAQERAAQERAAQERAAQERAAQERGAQEGPREPKHGALTGFPWHDVKAKLRDVGLRPTRQRMALGWILFAKGDRHVTAEVLFEEANRAKVPVSLATVYNTLHQFTEVGLLRQVAVDGSRAYFDTNNSMHHHFFIEDQNELLDIPAGDVMVGNAPVPPEGYEIARIDIVVRLRRKQA